MADTTRQSLLISLLNVQRANNGLSLITASNYNFSNPCVYYGTEVGFNTIVNLIPYVGVTDQSRLTLKYNRISFNSLLNKTVARTGTNISDLLPSISAACGIIINNFDIIDGPQPSSGNTFELVANPTSYIFIDSTSFTYSN